MHVLTAILRARPGHGETVLAALLDVAAHVRAHEPDTLGFHVARSEADPLVFVTYERFRDEGAMRRHNDGPGSKAFFEVCGDLLDGPATVVTGPEIGAVP
jgi:quinol monooxygenase YgiN